MSGARLNNLGKTLAIAAVIEVGTGLALIIDPAKVIALLLGTIEAGLGIPLARFLGIALLALGLACWPGGNREEVRFEALPGDVDVQSVGRAVSGVRGHVRRSGRPAVVAGRCAACQCSAASDLDVAHRPTGYGI